MRISAGQGLLLGVALLWLAPLLARADAITMPPSCPEGSRDAFCHGPATCEPRGCVSSTDCAAGEVCAARALCTVSHTCFGFPMSTLVDHVLGPCDASGDCAAGGTCGSLFVCAPGVVTPDAGHPGSDAGVVPEHGTYCGCRAGGRGGSLSFAALGVLALVARRVRRRR